MNLFWMHLLYYHCSLDGPDSNLSPRVSKFSEPALLLPTTETYYKSMQPNIYLVIL